jgi:hypothetical protein
MINEIAAFDFQRDKINELYIQAVRNGSISQIKWTIENGADIHFQNDMALDTASTFKHLEVLKFLNNDLGLELIKQERCLFDACRHNDIGMIQFIVEECGMDVQVNENRPIRNAVMTDALEAFLYLKEKGASLTDTEVNTMRRTGEPKFKTSTLANIAWMHSSTDCMKEILPKNRRLFFSDNNIIYEFNASNVMSKIENNSSIVNYAVGELLKFSPEKFDLFLSTKDKLDEAKQEQFSKWLQWLKLDNDLGEKKEKTKTLKI